MWMAKWAKSKIPKKFVPNCSLYLIMPIFSSSAKPKILNPLQGSVWPHCQHTHTQQNKTECMAMRDLTSRPVVFLGRCGSLIVHGFVMGPLQFQSTVQNSQLALKKQHFGYVGFHEKFDTLPLKPKLKPTKTDPSFRKIHSSPYKTRYGWPSGQGVRVLLITGLRWTHKNVRNMLINHWKQIEHTYNLWPAASNNRTDFTKCIWACGMPHPGFTSCNWPWVNNSSTSSKLLNQDDPRGRNPPWPSEYSTTGEYPSACTQIYIANVVVT